VGEEEDEGDMQGLGEGLGVGGAPGEGGETEQKREEVCEGGVWPVVGFGGLFLGERGRSLAQVCVGVQGATTYVVVDLPKHLFRREQKAHNLPHGHLKVHLRELEQPLEEAGHAGFVAARGRGGAEVGRLAGGPWELDVRIHGVQTRGVWPGSA